MLYILVILFGFIGNIFCNVICNGYSNYTLNNVNYTDTVGSKECIDDVCVYFNGVVTCDRTTEDSIVVKEDKFFGIFVGCYEDFEALININPFIKWPEIESDMKTCKSVPHGFHLRFVDRIGSYYGGFSLKCTTNGDYDKIVFGTSDTSLREDDLDEVMFNKSVLQNFTSDNTTTFDDIEDSISIQTNNLDDHLTSNDSFRDDFITELNNNAYILPTDSPYEEELYNLYLKDMEEKKNGCKKTTLFISNLLLISFIYIFL